MAANSALELEHAVFRQFTKAGYYVCEENNFGARFAVYSTDPDGEGHADYLVFIGKNLRVYTVNRLATIVKKKVVYHKKAIWACFDELGEVRYHTLERVMTEEMEREKQPSAFKSSNNNR